MVMFSQGQSMVGPSRLLVAIENEATRSELINHLGSTMEVVPIASYEAASKIALDSFDAAVIDEPFGPVAYRLAVEMTKYLPPHRIYVRTTSADAVREYFDERGWRYISVSDDLAILKTILGLSVKYASDRVSTERNRPAFTADFDRRHRLLVVDDEPQQCQVQKAVFSPRLDVVTAASVAEAQAKYDLDTFDAAIIDWHLPGESGMALARELRRYVPAKRIILYTADDAAAPLGGTSFTVVSKSTPTEKLENDLYAALEKVKPKRIQLNQIMENRHVRASDLNEDGTPKRLARMLIVEPGQAERAMLRDLCAPYFELTVTSDAKEARRLQLDTFDIAIVSHNRRYSDLDGIAGDLRISIGKERIYRLGSQEEFQFDRNSQDFDKQMEPEFLLSSLRDAMREKAIPSSWAFRIPTLGQQREATQIPDDGAVRLLIVDDEQSQCTSLKALFSSKMQVVTGTSVVEITGSHDLSRFNAAIIDWHLPGESGISLARLLGEHLHQDCIFLYTADDQAMKYETSAFRYLSKSMSSEDLEKRVLDAVAKYPRARKARRA